MGVGIDEVLEKLAESIHNGLVTVAGNCRGLVEDT